MKTSSQQGALTSAEPFLLIGNAEAEPSLSISSYTSTHSDPGPSSPTPNNVDQSHRRARSRSLGEEKEVVDIEEAKLEKVVVIKPASRETKQAISEIKKEIDGFFSEFNERFVKSKQYQGMLRLYREKNKSEQLLAEDLDYTYRHILGEVIEVLAWMELKNNSVWSMLYYSGELYNAISYAAVTLASEMGYDNGHSAHQRAPRLKDGLFEVAPFEALEMRKKENGKIDYVLSSRDTLAKKSVDPSVMTAYVPVCYGTKKDGFKTVRGILRSYLEAGADVVLYFGPFGDVQIPHNERNNTGVRHRAAWLRDNYALLVDLEKDIHSNGKKKNAKKVGTFRIMYGHTYKLSQGKEVVGLHEGEAYQKTYLDFYSHLLKHRDLWDEFYEHLTNDVVKYLSHGKYPEYRVKPARDSAPITDSPIVRSQDLRRQGFELAINKITDALIKTPKNEDLREMLVKLIDSFDKIEQNAPLLSSSAAIHTSLQQAPRSREPSPVSPIVGLYPSQNGKVAPLLSLRHSQSDDMQATSPLPSPKSGGEKAAFFNKSQSPRAQPQRDVPEEVTSLRKRH